MSKYLQTIEACDENNTTITITPNIRPLIDMLSYYVARAKIQANGIGKIIVTFSNTKQYTDSYEERLDVTLIKTNSPINIQEINTLPPDELREKNLLRIYGPIHRLFQQKNINTAPLEQALELIKNKHFIFEEQWQSKWNPAKTTQATIRWLYKERFHFYLDAYHKNEKTTQNIFFTTAACGLGLIQLCLGQLKWQNNHLVRLYQNNKRDYWEINIQTQEINFFYQPALSGNPHAQYNLAINYLEGHFGLHPNIEKAHYWLQQAAQQGFAKAIKRLEEINIPSLP